MKQTTWMTIVSLFATSMAFAQDPSSVAIGAAAARRALGGMRFTADEVETAPVPDVPEAQPVPNPVEDITHLTYDREPGLTLYRNMKSLDDLAIKPCSGAECLGLFGIQESYAYNFSSSYKATIPLIYTADKMLGDAAHDLASHICQHTYQSGGDDNAISSIFRMLYTQNEMLTYLKVVQSNAGRKAGDIAACMPSQLEVDGHSNAPKPPPPPKPAPKPTKPAQKQAKPK